MENIRNCNENVSFCITFVNAQAFKNLIEYLRLCGKLGDFYLSERLIRIECLNILKGVYSIVIIDTTFLTQYCLNIHDEIETSSESSENFKKSKEEQIFLRLDLTKMRDLVKNAKKKDAIMIYKKPGNETIYVKVHSSKSGSTKGTSWILPEVVTKKISPHGDFEYEFNESNPNCTISINEFCSSCADFKTMGCNGNISVFNHGLSLFSTTSDSNIVGTAYEFGFIEKNFNDVVLDTSESVSNCIVNENVEKIVEIKIKSDLSSCLTKLSGVFPDGVIRVFAEPEMPIKLICSVGDFGLLKTHIIDVSKNDNYLKSQ